MAYTYNSHIIYTVTVIIGLTLFSSCSSDDNPVPDSGTIPIVWSDGVLPGLFSVNADGQHSRCSFHKATYSIGHPLALGALPSISTTWWVMRQQATYMKTA